MAVGPQVGPNRSVRIWSHGPQLSEEAGCPVTDKVNPGQGQKGGRAQDRTLHWDPDGIWGAQRRSICIRATTHAPV